MGWSGGGEVRAAPSRDLCDQSPHLQLHRRLCKILETIVNCQNIRGPSKVAADGGGIFVGQIRSSNPFSNKCENRIGKERVGKWEKEFRYVRNVTRYEKRYRISGIISTIISTSRGSHTTVRPSLHNCFLFVCSTYRGSFWRHWWIDEIFIFSWLRQWRRTNCFVLLLEWIIAKSFCKQKESRTFSSTRVETQWIACI